MNVEGPTRTGFSNQFALTIGRQTQVGKLAACSSAAMRHSPDDLALDWEEVTAASSQVGPTTDLHSLKGR